MLKVKNGNYANQKYKVVYESRAGELAQIHCTDGMKQWIEKKSANLLSSYTLLQICTMNINEMPENRDIMDREFIYDLIICFGLFLLIRVYIGEEDQHELYFLQKRMQGSGSDTHTLMEEFFSEEKNGNLFFSVNDKIVSKKHYEKYKEKIDRLARFIQIFKPDLVKIDIESKENGETYVCDLNLNYGDYVINKEFESTGIRKLIRLFDCFFMASTVGIVFIDEMDANLNDVYLCRLIEYFMYYGKGQLCFTTHNLDPMSVLKENRNSIDFLSSDNHLVSWTSRGNALPENCYRNGMIEDSPFNIDATDFIGILGE